MESPLRAAAFGRRGCAEDAPCEEHVDGCVVGLGGEEVLRVLEEPRGGGRTGGVVAAMLHTWFTADIVQEFAISLEQGGGRR